MSEKKPSYNNRFRSNVFTDSLEDLHKFISSKRSYIIAGSILSLGIALGSGLETDRFAKKWLEKEINHDVELVSNGIDENKTKQIDTLNDKLVLKSKESSDLIKELRRDKEIKINDNKTNKDKKLDDNEAVRNSLRKKYEARINLIRDSLDRRVRAEVEKQMGPYPTDRIKLQLCYVLGKCEERDRLHQQLKPQIELQQIDPLVAIREKELEQELENIVFKPTDDQIIAEAAKEKNRIESYFNEKIENIKDDINSFSREIDKQKKVIVQEAQAQKERSKKNIVDNINREFRSTTLRIAMTSAILGSVFGAMTTILLILLLVEYVVLKNSISDKLWFKHYKSFVLQFWAVLFIGCSAAISLELFTAKTEQEKEHITWIALPTARTGALVSSISSLLSSVFLIQALLASKNSVNPEQKKFNSDSGRKPYLSETKNNGIKQSLTDSDTIEQKQGLEETITNNKDLPKTKNIPIEYLGANFKPEATDNQDELIDNLIDKLITVDKKTD